MKLSYAITVCNESKDLYSLISFLKGVKDTEDEINILLDTLHGSQSVRNVLEYFKDDVIVFERDFDGNFAKHRNFHLKKCTGDYIFVIDPDEMPKEKLIKSLKQAIQESGSDLILIPRMNLHPGFTQEWLDKCNFKVNEMDWINWPDYQGRVFKNDPTITYGNELHENIIGAKKVVNLHPDPTIALWHIKSIDKQDNRWDTDGKYISPDGKNFYDSLM
jgi:hypothetical protein